MLKNHLFHRRKLGVVTTVFVCLLVQWSPCSGMAETLQGQGSIAISVQENEGEPLPSVDAIVQEDASAPGGESSDIPTSSMTSASQGGETPDVSGEKGGADDSGSIILLLSLIAVILLVQLGHILTGTTELLEPNLDVESTPESVAIEPPVDPGPLGLTDEEAGDLGLQAWRLTQRVGQLSAEDHPKLRRRLEDSVTQFTRISTAHGITVEDPVGKPFVDGWSELRVISSERLTPWPRGDDARPFVNETIQPIIRRNGKTIQQAHVIIGEPYREDSR